MSTPTLELNQEGYLRPEGYQCVQWIEQGLGTVPDTNAGIFIIRNVLGAESLERVATLNDYSVYPSVNELKYFEGKFDVGNGEMYGALPGDVLTIAPSVDTWIQEDQVPYTDCVFTVDGLEVLAFGGSPVLTAPQYLTLPGHTFTDDDVGRVFQLFGMAGQPPVISVVVTAQGGSVATIAPGSLVWTSVISGASWNTKRVRITTDLGPGIQPRYFATTAQNLGWVITRGSMTVAFGARGTAQRKDPLAALSRDRRVTTVEPTADGANALFTVTLAAAQQLQAQLATVGADWSFPLKTTDIPGV